MHSQYCLGLLYWNGKYIAQDYGNAVKYFTLAAEQGHKKVQSRIGEAYEFGRGLSKDKINRIRGTISQQQTAAKTQRRAEMKLLKK
jgi:TPR repeat protein